MSISQAIQDMNKVAKSTFGNDIKVLVARSPAFGDNDFCIIFTGTNQEQAAKVFNLKFKGEVSTEEKEMFGESYKTTKLVFAA